MSPELQRIAIAEACGWKQEVRRKYAGAKNVSGWGKNTDLHPGDRHRRFILLPCQFPDYLNDLNAMHEAEKMLYSGDGRFDRWCEYWEALEALTQCRTFDKDINSDCLSMLHATAAQRAEAFLRTLNKWSDQ